MSKRNSTTPRKKQVRPLAQIPTPVKKETPGVEIPPRPVVKAAPPRTPPRKSGPDWRMLAGVGVAVIAVVVALFIIAPWKSNSAPAPAADNSAIPVGADAGATIEQFPSEGRDHVAPGTRVSYKTNPPTSGNHYPNWLNWGVYDKPQQDELMVHNLEHGGVIIYYDCPNGCGSAVEALKPYALRYPADTFTGIMLVPRSNLPNNARIALVAWQSRLLLKSLDLNKINDFIAQRFNKGPEGNPMTQP